LEPAYLIPVAITAVAVLSAAGGVWLSSLRGLSRRLVPFSGGVLMGVAIFWVLPEMADFFRWPAALAWIAAGFALLLVIDRYVYPVCPSCSPTHDHHDCTSQLHGFATPLLIAAALHSALDGWTAVAAQSASFGGAFLLGIAAHKIPEGIALGIIARAALERRAAAMGWCILAESATLAGAGLEAVLAPHIGAHGLHALLALAGGSFLYLGGHAIHGESRRSGPAPAFVSALTGVAGSSVLRLFVSP
jgi:zinc and cadmium transporter